MQAGGLETVDQVPLADGDQFRIGDTHLIYRTEEDPTEVFDDPPNWS